METEVNTSFMMALATATGPARIGIMGLFHQDLFFETTEIWVEGRAPGHAAAMRQMMQQMEAQADKAA